MVKIAHAVRPIMAGLAARASLLQMGRHELGVIPAVTVGAGFVGHAGVRSLAMTISTRQRRGIEIELVPGQAEIRHRMVKEPVRGGNRIEIAALVFWVTGIAARHVHHLAMQPLSISHLCSNLRMTFVAFLRQRGAQRVVAKTTALLELSMRAVPFNRHAGPAFGRHRARAEGQPTVAPQ